MGRRIGLVLGMVALAAIACVVRASMAARLGPDLIGNATGGWLALHDVGHLYDRDAQHIHEIAITGSPLFLDLFISPPHTALLFAPFGALPFRVTLALFSALSFVAFGAALLKARALSTEERAFAAFALAFAASEPLAETIIIGQTSGFALLLWVVGIRLAMDEKDTAAGGSYLAGVILGLGAFKPQLFWLVPVVLVARKRWRMLGAFLGTVLALVAIGALGCGPHAYVEWIALLRSPAYGDVREANMFHMCSIEALLHGVVPSPVAMGVQVLVAAVGIVALFRFARHADASHAWAAAILVTLFATPHVIIYDVVLVIVPVLVLARDATKNRATRIAVLATFGLAWLVPVMRVPILSLPIVYLTWRLMSPSRARLESS